MSLARNATVRGVCNGAPKFTRTIVLETLWFFNNNWLLTITNWLLLEAHLRLTVHFWLHHRLLHHRLLNSNLYLNANNALVFETMSYLKMANMVTLEVKWNAFFFWTTSELG